MKAFMPKRFLISIIILQVLMPLQSASAMNWRYFFQLLLKKTQILSERKNSPICNQMTTLDSFPDENTSQSESIYTAQFTFILQDAQTFFTLDENALRAKYNASQSLSKKVHTVFKEQLQSISKSEGSDYLEEDLLAITSQISIAEINAFSAAVFRQEPDLLRNFFENLKYLKNHPDQKRALQNKVYWMLNHCQHNALGMFGTALNPRWNPNELIRILSLRMSDLAQK